MDKAEQAYRDFYHKIKASVGLDEWRSIWNFIEKRLGQPAASAESLIVAHRIMRTGDYPGTAWIDGAPPEGSTGTEVYGDGYFELAYSGPSLDAVRYRNLRQATVTGNQEWLDRLMKALPIAVTIGGRDPTPAEFDAAIDVAGECNA